MLRIGRGSSEVVSARLRNLAGNGTWSDLFTRSKRFISVTVRAEAIDFDRADVFIGDINSKTKGAFAELTVEHLILLLYTDFLLDIRENLNGEKIDAESVTMEDVIRSLIQKRKIYFPRQKRSEMSQHSIARKRWALMEVQLRKDAAKRGEVFLYDANTVFPEFEMALDELLSILFCDFIARLRRGQRELINALLDRFFSYDFQGEYWPI